MLADLLRRNCRGRKSRTASRRSGSILVEALEQRLLLTSLVEQEKLVASDAAGQNRFGTGVGLDGDTAIIGAVNGDGDPLSNTGSAYIFQRSGSTWNEEAELTASDAETGDAFGYAVAVDGDIAVVGAYLDDHGAGVDAGSAYVFRHVSGNWVEEAKLTAGDGADFHNFGLSVAIDGGTIVVNSRWGNASDVAGAAYVYTWDGTGWTQQAKLVANDATVNDEFSSVDIDGDTVVVGSHKDDDQGFWSGSAYVFQRTGTSWSQEAKLTASDAAAQQFFGVSVSVDGDIAAIGATRADGGGTNPGSAYIFERNGTVWSEQAKLLPSDTASNDKFGYATAIDGETVVVGAFFNDFQDEDAGAAYVFQRIGTDWTETVQLTASDPGQGEDFGFSVAVDGGTVLVGARGDNHVPDTSGAAYVFVPDVITVDVDVKPDSNHDTVNLASNGVVPVVVLSTVDFDASMIDATSVTFGGAFAEHSVLEDVDGDGDLDLMLHFRVQEMVELEAAYRYALVADLEDNGILDDNHQDVLVTLLGSTIDGLNIEGFDAIDAFLAGNALKNELSSV